MDSEAESEKSEEEEASEESDSGVASLALATAFVSKSVFNSEENDFPNTADDYSPTYCFMAKGAKVLKYPSYKSSEDESDKNLKPSYSKLAKIVVKQ